MILPPNTVISTDNSRLLGVGEKIQWGDIKRFGVGYAMCDVHDISYIISEDTQTEYRRPLIRETAPHIFDERNAPIMAVLADANSLSEPQKAKTYDNGKAPLAYIPWAAVREMAQVQAYGHKKYHDWNNYRKGMEVGRNLSCAIRHIAEFMDGTDLDAESGRSHLAHAMCRLAFVLQNQADGTAIDDRYKGGAK